MAAYSASVLKVMMDVVFWFGWRPRSWRFWEAVRCRSVAIVVRDWGVGLLVEVEVVCGCEVSSGGGAVVGLLVLWNMGWYVLGDVGSGFDVLYVSPVENRETLGVGFGSWTCSSL